jgi:hypothetical protein
MNRAIDSAAAEKRRVRRVHNRVNIEFRDVAADNVNFANTKSSSQLHVAYAT